MHQCSRYSLKFEGTFNDICGLIVATSGSVPRVIVAVPFNVGGTDSLSAYSSDVDVNSSSFSSAVDGIDGVEVSLTLVE